MARFYRNRFGGIFLFIVVLVRREAFWGGGRAFLIAVAAAGLFAADLSLWHRSVIYLGPGLATLVANFQVFFLAGFGILVFKEAVGWRFLVSIPLGVAGLFLLLGIDWNTLEPGYRQGVYLGLAAALSYAVFLLVLRRSQSNAVRLPASTNLLIISFVTALIMGVEGYLQRESFTIPDRGSMASMVAYGVLSHSLGWMAISRGLAHVDASRAGLILLLQPTQSFIWDRLFFGRVLTSLDIAGAILALGAIYIGGTRGRPQLPAASISVDLTERLREHDSGQKPTR